jgi:hypothetical protein
MADLRDAARDLIEHPVRPAKPLAVLASRVRFRRRRRLGLVITAMAVPAAVVAALILSSVDAPGRVTVNVVAPNDGAAACRGGAVPRGTQAREGAGIVFGWLPAGWKTVADTGPTEFSASPTGREVNGQPSVYADYQIIATPVSTLFAPSGQKPAGSYPIVSVSGHPAQFFTPDKGEMLGTSVTWEPVPDVVVTLNNNAQLSQRVLLRVADGVRFDPGVTPADVGDLVSCPVEGSRK